MRKKEKNTLTARAAVLVAFVVVACLLTMTACVDRQQKVVEQQRRSDSLALKVGVLPTLDCLPIYVAHESGLFDSLGVDVRLKPMQAQIDCDKALQRHEVEMSVTDLMRAERLNRLGTPLTYVTTTNAYWQLFSNRLIRVRKADQLGDKMMAMTRYSATDYLGTLAVDSARPRYPVFRVQINDVDVRLNMLLNNEMDAALLTEPQATKARLAKHPVLMDSRHKDISLGAIVIRTDLLNDEHRLLQREAFAKAYNQACDSINLLGIPHYANIVTRYCHVGADVVKALPALTFPHTEAPREKDLARTRNVTWKTY